MSLSSISVQWRRPRWPFFRRALMGATILCHNDPRPNSFRRRTWVSPRCLLLALEALLVRIHDVLTVSSKMPCKNSHCYRATRYPPKHNFNRAPTVGSQTQNQTISFYLRKYHTIGKRYGCSACIHRNVPVRETEAV